MSNYYNISADEMRKFLKPEKGWMESTAGKELVFNYKIQSRPELLVKVYSGIKTLNEISRGCGKDAIRVCVINTKTNFGWIKCRRTYRTVGWQKNLKQNILDAIDLAKKRN